MKSQYRFSYNIYQHLFLIFILIKCINGELESNIVCRFDNGNQTLYWPGQIVSGTIEFDNNGDHELVLKSVKAELIGEVLHMKTGTKGTQEAAQATILKKEQTLYSHPNQTRFVLSYGNYSWPFKFLLDDIIPPSIQKYGSYPSIRYFIRVTLIKPEWYKFNIQKSIPFFIQFASAPTPLNSTPLAIGKKNRKNVYLCVTLEKRIAIVGKNFSVKVEIENPDKVRVRGISVTLMLYMHCNIGKDANKSIFMNQNIVNTNTVLMHQDLTTSQQLRDKHFEENFTLSIPKTASATFSLATFLNNNFLRLNVSHEIRFEARVRGLFTNIRLKAPLILHSYPEKN